MLTAHICSPLLRYYQTIPIPQDSTEATELLHQALAKRRGALHKSELADAAVKQALLATSLCRSQAQHAKHVLDAANVYISHVKRTIQQSKHKNILSKRTYRVTTETSPGVHGVQRMQLFSCNEHH